MVYRSTHNNHILRDALPTMDEESFLIMAHNLSMIIIIIDMDLKLIFGNDILFDLVDQEPDKVLNKDYVDTFIPPDSRLIVRSTLQNILHKDTPNYSGANKVMTQNKGDRLVNWNSIHLHSKTGETTGMLCLGIDITETQSLNNVLARADREKTVLLNNVLELVIYCDEDGRITWVNKSFLDMFADNLKSVIGSYTHEIFISNHAELIDNLTVHKRALLTGQGQILRVQLPDESWWHGLIFGFQEDSMHSRQFAMVLSPAPQEDCPDQNRENNKENNAFPPIVNRYIGQKEGVVIVSDAMQHVMKQAEILHRDRDVPVLIEGETGTGKEIVARYVHYGHDTIPLPFVDINCPAIAPSIFESELFGYEGGAFTGGRSRGQQGKIALAQSGTLFLDEIGEIPVNIQAKLLRVIQEKEYYRVGGLRKNIADVRWICATNIDLEKSVHEGTFREDLFYRLEAFHLYIPPLRERCEDILPMAKMFLAVLSRKKGKQFKGINQEAAKLLVEYLWPGNVRQLHNFIERIVLLYDDTEITPEHLSFLFRKQRNLSPNKLMGGITMPPDYFDLEEHNKRIICQALELNRGNKTKTAAYLGMSRRALTYRLSKLGLEK